jgi:hypothetical protein
MPQVARRCYSWDGGRTGGSNVTRDATVTLLGRSNRLVVFFWCLPPAPTGTPPTSFVSHSSGQIHRVGRKHWLGLWGCCIGSGAGGRGLLLVNPEPRAIKFCQLSTLQRLGHESQEINCSVWGSLQVVGGSSGPDNFGFEDA